MNCINCNNKINNDTIKCPFCGYDIAENKTKLEAVCSFCKSKMGYKETKCPSCGKKHAMSASATIKMFIGLFLLFSFGPFIIALIVIAFGFAIDSKLISINNLVTIVKAIIYIIICIPLVIAALGYQGKILKNSTKKDIICLVLSIISTIGIIGFTTFIKNFKVQFNDYDKQEYITLNKISAPTLYKVTNYKDTFLAVKLKDFDNNFQAEEITIQTKEPVPNEILNNYKKELLNNGYTYFGIVDEETEVYIYTKNNYYMLVGFIDDHKNIIYLSFDQKNYNKFINSFKITKE